MVISDIFRSIALKIHYTMNIATNYTEELWNSLAKETSVRMAGGQLLSDYDSEVIPRAILIDSMERNANGIALNLPDSEPSVVRIDLAKCHLVSNEEFLAKMKIMFPKESNRFHYIASASDAIAIEQVTRALFGGGKCFSVGTYSDGAVAQYDDSDHTCHYLLIKDCGPLEHSEEISTLSGYIERLVDVSS